MRIKGIQIKEGFLIQDGLSEITMDGLREMVLVVGKNGAGKSRLLSKVKSAVENQIVPSVTIDLQRKIDIYSQNIKSLYAELDTLENNLSAGTILPHHYQTSVDHINSNIQSHKQTIQQLQKDLANDFITYDGNLIRQSVIEFVPKNINLADPRYLNSADIQNRSTNLTNTLNINSLHDWSLARIQDLHVQFWNATHQHTPLPDEKKLEIKESYAGLQETIRSLVGVELGTNERTEATLFGFPIGDSRLSDGQKVLLQLAVAIHAHNLKLSESILLLDEPENHLHPAAIIDVIEKLKSAIPQGQIWVATHSISIIAHFFEEASVYYLDDGKISKSGKEKTTVLESLLGNEERVRRQVAFLEEPITHAMVTYAAQCLLPPAVVTTGVADPQMTQIKEAIFNSKATSKKVLDFGSGKGRLITNIIETAPNELAISSQLDYIALDSDLANMDECKQQISRVYPDPDERWFKTTQELLVKHNKGSFDVIVMTNVLHEVSPTDWINLFGPEGELTKLLSKSGYLLLVEDQRIPVGETAHEFGFIVLDTCSLKELCKISGSDQQIIQDSQRDGRLKAHLIPREHLERIDRQSIKSALEEHCRHSKREIEELRRHRDKSKAKLFAFWIHQYANTNLALGHFQ